MNEPVIRIAIHPSLAPLVLAEEALGELGRLADVRTVDPGLWATGWPDDEEVEVLVTGWGTPPIDQQALDAMPRLRAVAHAAGSVRGLITDAVWDRDIVVVSAADANNDFVAAFVAAHILLALKGSHRAGAVLEREGRSPGFTAGPGSRGRTIGLVSFGSIARKVRELVRPFSMDVITWDPFVSDADLAASGVRRVETLAALFEDSHVVSVHAPLIPGETEGLIGAELVASLRQGATLINTARGAIIREAELIDVLRERPDLLAILDVTWPEPPSSDSALFSTPNIVLTGHTAGAVGSECLALGDLAIREVVHLLAGERVDHTVSKDLAAVRA